MTDEKIIKTELFRKAIHLSSSLAAVLYIFLSKEFMLIFTGTGLAFMLFLDIGKKYSAFIEKYYLMILSPVLRAKEKNVKSNLFTGGTYLVISVFLSILFFEKSIAVKSILILTISDSLAAIIGRLAGRIRIGNKTLEGSIAFFISAIIITYVIPTYEYTGLTFYFAGFIAVLITTVIEQITGFLDDNLSIPLTFGVLYTIFLKIL